MRYFVCIDNDGFESSLEKRKIYYGELNQFGLLSIIDEEGEEYLYKESLFEEIEINDKIRSKLEMA
jgi:hypothetical protein